jgi:hypothetical protein
VQTSVLMVATAAVLLLVPLVVASPLPLYGTALLGLTARFILGAVSGGCRLRRGRRRHRHRRSGLASDEPRGPRDD